MSNTTATKPSWGKTWDADDTAEDKECCGRTFASPATLGQHLVKKHGWSKADVSQGMA